ncbi:unnamed protein product [Closterium sp. NIES-64]|nr:unnamed protein product [Closterium sp. NIES-64]
MTAIRPHRVPHHATRHAPIATLLVVIVLALKSHAASFTISRPATDSPRGRKLGEMPTPRPADPRYAAPSRSRGLHELGVREQETLLSGTIIIEQPESAIGAVEIYVDDGMHAESRSAVAVSRSGVANDRGSSQPVASNSPKAPNSPAAASASSLESRASPASRSLVISALAAEASDNAAGAAAGAGDVSTTCDISDGMWEADANRPLYSSLDCPFIHAATQCDAHGRPDTGYQKLRWRPTRDNATEGGGCDAMPQLTAKSACELMRNRNVAYVGDSIVRNHFNSLACIMFGTQGEPEVLGSHPYAQVYHWPSCNATVAFYWSHYLVNLTLIDEHVFNTGGELDLENPDDWWFRHYNEHDTFVISAGQWWSSVRIQGKNIHFASPNTDLPLFDAYQTALFSVLRPFEDVSSTGKQVVLTLVPPTHGFHGSCSATQPVSAEDALSKDYPEAKYNILLADVARRYEARRAKRGHGAPLMLLDIFGMSLTRWDGHPGEHSGGGNIDCGHYCLPGVPDSWNEMMLGLLWVQDGRGRGGVAGGKLQSLTQAAARLPHTNSDTPLASSAPMALFSSGVPLQGGGVRRTGGVPGVSGREQGDKRQGSSWAPAHRPSSSEPLEPSSPPFRSPFCLRPPSPLLGGPADSPSSKLIVHRHLSCQVGLQILLAASSSSIVIRAANLVVGVGFPVFRSFKAIEEGSQADRNRCLAYWSVYGCFRVVETITDRIISWLPFYQHIKLLLLLWLQLPSTSSSRPATGAGRLYASHLRPVLLRYRRHIDGALVSIDRCMASWFHAHQEELSAAARMAQSATRAALTALDSAVSSAAAALPPPAADGPPAAMSAADADARNDVTDDVSGPNRDGGELHDVAGGGESGEEGDGGGGGGMRGGRR